MKYIAVCLFLFLSCATTYQMKKSDRIQFDFQGHRGCRGLMPENTIPAMLTALDLGVTTLEMDVVVTEDNQLVLSHEPFFNHEITTKPHGQLVSSQEEKSLNIYKMTYNEVKQFDVGLKYHPRFPQQKKISAVKPLLIDVIDRVEQYILSKSLKPVIYNIETKCDPITDKIYHPEPDQFVELLVEVIRSKKMEERVIIQSFDFRTLQYLHQKYPGIKTAMLIEDLDKRGPEQLLKDIGFQPHIYSPHYSLVNSKLINFCHQRKMKVIPWTVNELQSMKELKEMGVDGLISDYPDLFKKL
jgi:glycerophosphoryl diester phosphodiesterase